MEYVKTNDLLCEIEDTDMKFSSVGEVRNQLDKTSAGCFFGFKVSEKYSDEMLERWFNSYMGCADEVSEKLKSENTMFTSAILLTNTGEVVLQFVLFEGEQVQDSWDLPISYPEAVNLTYRIGVFLKFLETKNIPIDMFQETMRKVTDTLKDKMDSLGLLENERTDE